MDEYVTINGTLVLSLRICRGVVFFNYSFILNYLQLISIHLREICKYPLFPNFICSYLHNSEINISNKTPWK